MRDLRSAAWLLISLGLAACSPGAGDAPGPAVIVEPTATFGASVPAGPTATPEATVVAQTPAATAVLGTSVPAGPTATAGATAAAKTATASPSATRPSRTPALPATAAPSPQATARASEALPELSSPALVDSAAGRIYAAGGDPARIFVFSARDGRQLAAYGGVGLFALDPARGRLYVDWGEEELEMLDADDGALLRSFSLPSSSLPRGGRVGPHLDPATGRVLAARGNVVYAIDPDTGDIDVLVEFSVTGDDGVLPKDQLLAIRRWTYDGDRRILYAGFQTYSRIPYEGQTIVAYDIAAEREVGRYGGSTFLKLTADNGRLYGANWESRPGYGTLWLSEPGQNRGAGSTDWSAGGSVFVDRARNRLYWQGDADLRVLDAADLHLLMVVAPPHPGTLLAYDPATDQLYFEDRERGRLAPYPATAIRPPAPGLPPPVAPPNAPVAELAVAPDGTLVGIWGSESAYACDVWRPDGGALLVSTDGGAQWRSARAGLPAGCKLVSAVALSPQYAADHTLAAGVPGAGVFMSADGGAFWRPAGRGLDSMAVSKLLFSPGFAVDRTVFALTGSASPSLERSTDAGATWAVLPIGPVDLALSPDFAEDGALLATVRTSEGKSEFRASRDRGNTWEQAGSLPDGRPVSMLSMAPLYARWGILFAFSPSGSLHRSGDRGQSWQEVLDSGVEDGRARIVYAPDIEVNRPVFLLVADASYPLEDSQRKLFRSLDGGQAWEQVDPGAGVAPTALAISPRFVQDGLIYVGAADGRVLKLNGLALPAASP